MPDGRVDKTMSLSLSILSILLLIPASVAQTNSDSLRDQSLGKYRAEMALANWSKNHHLFLEAGTHYQNAFNIAKSLFGDRSPELCAALNSIGEMQLAEGQVLDANRSFHHALILLTDTDRIGKAFVLNNLAAVARSAGNTARATELVRQVVETLDQEQVHDPENLGIALSNLATLLRETGRSGAAMSNAQRAVSLLEHCNNSEHLIVSLTTLGRLLLDQNDFEGANAVLKRAVNELDAVSASDTPTRALVLAHLGVLCGRTGRDREADQYFRRAIQIDQEFFAPANPVVLDALGAYADYLHAAKRNAEAKKLYSRIRKEEEKYREQNPSVDYVVDVRNLRKP
jgi:tetratricopeptide (TPR) repeat protein